MSKRYLNVGSGTRKLPGFINVDLNPVGNVQTNAVYGLPFQNNSIDGIFSEHFIEHIGQADGVAFLRECRRVLKPGGIVRISTPDLDTVIRYYVSDNWNDQPWMHKFGYDWIDNRCEMLNISMRDWEHKWLYNEEELRRFAGYAGLEFKQRCAINISDEPMFEGVEYRDESLTLEFTKPVRQFEPEPLVSIIIPAYNPTYLRQALESVMAQTYQNFEILLCDDNPSNAITDIVIPFSRNDDRIRYIKNEKNLGEILNFVHGFSLTKGEYIKPLHDDDVLHPTCLEKMVPYLAAMSEVTLVTSHRQRIDEANRHLPDDVNTQPIVSTKSRINGVSLGNLLLASGVNVIGEPSTVMFRKRDLETVEPSIFSVAGEPFSWNIDMAMWLNLLGEGDAIYLPDTLSYTRIHHQQARAAANAKENGLRSWMNMRTAGIRIGFLRLYWDGTLHIVPLSSTHTIAVIIVTYNSETSIRTCIDSVLENTRVPVEVVVVDNASADNTRTILVEYGDRINTILNDENLGFSAACNQGIRATEADFVMLLNPDTLVTPGWLRQLIAHFKPDVGAVGPLSDYVAGRQQFQLYLPKERPAEMDLTSLMELLRQHNRGKSVETKLLIGFCMVLSRAALNEVGLLDETLFLGNDDLDISWRLRNAGYRLLVATDTFIHHEGQVSFKTEAKSKTDALVQQSTDRLYEKLVAHYGEGNVPPPLELWGMDWFTPSNARFREPDAADTVPADDGLTSIIILVHNQLELTQDCLNSIEKHTPEPHEIIMVDNASTDGTPVFLRQYMAMHQNMRVIRNEENVGFAMGNNQALALARGDFVLFLNNDTVVSNGWLGKMRAVMAQFSEVGIVGPVSNMVSGPQQVTPDTTYTTFDEFAAFAQKWSDAHRGETVEFFRIVGFCMLVRRAVIDHIGGWDERYDIGNFEDDDFCIRAALAGFKARIAQDVYIHHIGRQTFKELNIDYRQQIDDNWRMFGEKWRIPAEFEMGKNYFAEVTAHTFTADDLSVPVPSAEDVLPLVVTVKPASAIVVLNGAEADTPEQVSAAAQTLLAQLPATMDAELWVTGAPDELPDGVVPKDDVLTALAEALLLAKTVTLVSADVTFAADGLAQLMAVAESQPTVAAIAPVSNVAPATHRLELPADDTAWASFAADRYRQYGEKITPVPYLGGFCVTLKAHHTRVVGGLNLQVSLGAALAELFRQLQKFGFQLARADGIAVRHTHLSAAEGAELTEREASQRQLAELLRPGQTALENNDLETAAREFSNAAAANPDAPEIHAILGSTLLTLGRTDEAIAALKKATELSPGEPSLKNQLGVVYFQAGRTNKAKKLFRAALAQDAQNLQAHLFLLDLFRMEKRFREAIVHAKSALRIDPENTDVLVAYGLLMLDLDDLDGAEMAWQHLADAPADNPGVLALMKGLLARGSRQVTTAAILPEIDAAQHAEDWTHAVTLLKSALSAPGSADAEKAELWNRLGSAHFHFGNATEAVAALNAGLELDPQNVDILSNLADVYLQQEQLDRATEYINRVLKINPNDVNTLMLLGNCAIRLQDLDVAQMAFRRVQEVAPETEGINQLVQELAQVTSGEQPEPDTAAGLSPEELLMQVEAAQGAERWADAAQLLLDALQSGNDFSAAERVEFLNRLGVSQFMAGKVDAAEDALLAALEIAPDDDGVLGNLADIYAAQEQFDRATEYLNRALAINPDDVHTLMSLGNCALQLEALDVAQMAFERVQTLAPETAGVDELVLQLRGLASASAESPSAKYDG